MNNIYLTSANKSQRKSRPFSRLRKKGGFLRFPGKETPAACTRDWHDYDEMVTPFPEQICVWMGIHHYVIWIGVAVVLLGFRLWTMWLCQEAVTLYPINIVYALLPSTLALLIIHYSKAAERMTNTFCEIIDGPDCKTIEWCEKEIKKVFSDWGMVVGGLIMILCFAWTIKETYLYPTSNHNIAHLIKVRDSKQMNLGRTVGEMAGNQVNTTTGWAQITVGKARQLAPDIMEDDLIKALENKVNVNKQAIEGYLKSLNKEKAQGLPFPNLSDNDRWTISQVSYTINAYILLFMSGAMLWCLGGIMILTWRLGKHKSVRIDVFPHPMDSIKAVGKFLGIIALINGILYFCVMNAMIISKPDALTLGITSAFSLSVIATFIVPQYNLHLLMLKIKYEKISPLATPLEEALNRAQRAPTKDNIDTAQSILDLQESLTVASEWPFDLQALITIMGSIAIPLLMAALALYSELH